MKRKKTYHPTDFEGAKPHEFPEIELPFAKSKETVWENMVPMLETPVEKAAPVIRMSWRQLAAVAVLFILVGLTGFLRFYSETIRSSVGEHLVVTLPDGSTVELNAQSSVKFHPYWWSFARKVQFEGEGFFKVAKGERFTVSSSAGRTMVLGTSFNIFSRGADYKVTCYTGSVRVVSRRTNENIILKPNDHVELEKSGRLKIRPHYEAERSTLWIKNMFEFTATPLHLVFEEVERQYGIKLTTRGTLDETYTGNFTTEKPIEEVLELVCSPFDLKFVKQPNGGYVILPNSP